MENAIFDLKRQVELDASKAAIIESKRSVLGFKLKHKEYSFQTIFKCADRC